MPTSERVTTEPVRRLFSFPDPVNEVSARLVAAGVVTMAVIAIAFDLPWLTLVIAYGFVARVLTGPTLSPLGQLVTRVVTPRLGLPARYVPGPPKRFAQGIGAVFSVTAAVLALALDQWGAAQVVLAVLATAAFLEAAFALCLGCKVFALLMRAGVIPISVCERCDDLWSAGYLVAPATGATVALGQDVDDDVDPDPEPARPRRQHTVKGRSSVG